MKRRKRTNSERRGSAILLTMAILSLLLIIAIFFTFDTIQSSRLSSNHKHSIQARLLQECGLNRAMALLDDFGAYRNKGNHFFLNPKDLFILGNSGQWEGLRCLPLMIDTNSSQDELETAFSVSLRTPDSTSSWQLTPTSLGSGFTNATWDSVVVDDRIIGVYSYLIVNETGKLDPGYLATGTTPNTKTKLGHINISDLGLPVGYVVDSCLSYAHFALAADPAASDCVTIRNTLFPGTIPIADEFWFDMDGDSECVAAEIFQRMDVTEVGDGGSISNDQLYRFLLTCDSSATELKPDSSLWMKGLSSAVLADDDARRKCAAQLVANIQDYTDSDSTPSVYLVKNDGTIETDSYPLSSSPDGATYEAAVVGAESRTVISELMWRVYADTTTITTLTYPGGDTDLLVDINVGFKCRAGDPMDIDLRKMRIVVDYTCSLEGKTPYPDSVGSITLDSSTSAMVVDGSYTEQSSYSSNMLRGSLILSDADTFKMTKFSINSITVYEYDGPTSSVTQKFPSFLQPGSAPTEFMSWTSSQFSETITAAATNVAYSAKVYVKDDPLMTLVSPSVDVTQWSGDVTGTVTPTSLQNTAFETSSKVIYANEPYCDAQCKNASITSLGELGRIHSPHTAMRSIKLWSRTSGEENDAYLLEMFTTVPKADGTRRTVNINTGSQAVVDALTSAISSADAQSDIRTEWLKKNGTTGGNPLLYRSDAQQFFAALATTSDEEAENALGTFIELLNTRQNYFTIISCARAIDDIGSANDPGHSRCMKIWSSPNRYGIVKGTHKTISAVYRDAWGIEKPRILHTTIVED